MHVCLESLLLFHWILRKGHAQSTFSWFQCRGQASNACQLSPFQGPCRVVISRSCLSELGKSLEFTLRIAAVSVPHGNSSAGPLAESKLNQAFWALQAVEYLDDKPHQERTPISPSWPGLLRFLLSSPSLLEALDELQTSTSHYIERADAAHHKQCEQVIWQKLLRATQEWRHRMVWPPEPVWKAICHSRSHITPCIMISTCS